MDTHLRAPIPSVTLLLHTGQQQIDLINCITGLLFDALASSEAAKCNNSFTAERYHAVLFGLQVGLVATIADAMQHTELMYLWVPLWHPDVRFNHLLNADALEQEKYLHLGLEAMQKDPTELQILVELIVHITAQLRIIDVLLCCS